MNNPGNGWRPGGARGLQNRCEVVILPWVGSIPTRSRYTRKGLEKIHLQAFSIFY